MSNPLLDELPILRELGADLTRAFLAGEAAARTDSQRRRAWVRRPSGVAGLAATAVGVAIALVLAVPGGGPSPPSATAALVHAAKAASAEPVPFPRDEQFYYVLSKTTSFEVIRSRPTTPLPSNERSMPKAVVMTENRIWVSASRPGVTRSRVLSIRLSGANRLLWRRLGRPSFEPVTESMSIGALGDGHYLLGNVELSRRQLLSTSTSPRELYAELYKAGGSPAAVFTEIGDTLRNRPAPARLRAALYRTLALIPGIRLVGRVTDGVGRPGTAVGLVHDGVEDELIFDESSSDMLAERTIVLSGGAKRFGLRAGTVLSSTTYLQRAVTDQPTVP